MLRVSKFSIGPAAWGKTVKTLKKVMPPPVTELSKFSPDKLAGMGAVAT